MKLQIERKRHEGGPSRQLFNLQFVRARGEMGDNLTTFNHLILEKVNKGLMRIEDAALNTFTGKMAKKYQYTKVLSISGPQNIDGTYKYVLSIKFCK